MTFRLAARNVFRHRTRTLITLSAIAFGCVSLIFTGGFFEDIFFKMQESYIHAHTGHLQIYRQGFYEHGNARPFDYLIEHPEALIAEIQQMAEVDYVTRRLQFSGLLSTGETTIACIGQGIEPDHEPTVRLNPQVSRGGNQTIRGSVIETGDPLAAADTFSAILGRGLAAGIGAKPGDGLILVANTVGGSINALDVTVKGTFFTSAKEFDDRVLRLPLPTAQRLLHTDAVQTLVVMLRKTDDTARVKAALEELFAQRQLPLEMKTWDELSDFYTKSRDFLGRLFLILKFIIAIIVILSIYNTMNMAVLERTSEIGTIMALGTKRRGVLQLFLAEGFVLGVVGGLLGVASGIAVTALTRHIGIPMPPPPGATIKWLSQPMIVPSVLVFAFGLSVVTSLISAYFPAYKASRLQIAEALRTRG